MVEWWSGGRMEENQRTQNVQQGTMNLEPHNLSSYKQLVINLLCAVGMYILLPGCDYGSIDAIPLKSTQEDEKQDGGLYTPSTQSILRGAHWLESVTSTDIRVANDFNATATLNSTDKKHTLSIHNIPINYLVPRLHYQAANPPDAFDAYNLMMAEYARNGISMPKGVKNDALAHFRSDLDEGSPWSLAGDFEFVPNPSFKPLRVSMTNNCLASGLWEVNAVDRAGEIYHAWFDMPADFYYKLVADVNKLPTEFVTSALQWNTKKIKTDLGRLRSKEKECGSVPVQILDSEPGFSSQDSRRKLHKGFVKINKNGAMVLPGNLSDYRKYPVLMSDFVPPGKYSIKNRKPFDVSFLYTAETSDLSLVKPLTNYNQMKGKEVAYKKTEYLETTIHLADHRKIIIGNLPMSLLVQQEDFVINGFGIGILPTGEVAERRTLLIKEGHHPSYAYLVEENNGEYYALNSHDAGIEQVFIRMHPFAETPHFTITITSFERITDLVKYKIPIPSTLLDIAKRYSNTYKPPNFYTYRDDNLR